ncbi:MAG: sortase [Chloroflexi bacterium]|nr:sortase [Chloroflexota bacterium]
MASKYQFAHVKKQTPNLVFLLVIFLALALPMPALADGPAPAALPTLDSFIETVKDGSISTLRGVYVQGVMAYPVIQQPANNAGYVSSLNGRLTQFKLASTYGTVGLLAHNYLAGASFSQLKEGDIITLVYGNGRTSSFMVTDIQSYKAQTPTSPYSNFTDLETNDFYTAEQLFKKVYAGEYRLTLQTCIEKDGDLSWGRLFIIAKPVTESTILKTGEIQG